MLKHKKAIMHICAFATTALWALGYVMTRVAVEQFSSEALSFLRYFIAALTLILYGVIKKTRLPKWKDVPIFIFGGAVGFAIYVYLINEGSRTLTASVVSFLVSAAPVVTALLARFLLREKIGIKGWVSIGCAFSGIALITYFSGGFDFRSGVALILLATILISIYNVFQRKLFNRYTPLEITTYSIIAGTILLSPFAQRAFPELMAASVNAVIAVLVLGILSGALAFLLWAYALSKADVTGEVTNYMFITPILTTILGFALINEAPHLTVYLGGALVLVGVILINYRKERV